MVLPGLVGRMNVILTNTVAVSGPPLAQEPTEEPGMADAPEEFPHWFFSAQEPAGRVFESQADLDAACDAGPWYRTPTAAADAAAQAAASQAEPHAPRARR